MSPHAAICWGVRLLALAALPFGLMHDGPRVLLAFGAAWLLFSP